MNDALPPPHDPERALALAYAPRARRAALNALFALDAQFAATLAQASDPMVARLRLTWWAEALARLDSAPPPRAPLLAALAREVLPFAVSGAMLAAMAKGWEALLVPDPLGADDLLAYAAGRGGLFALGGFALGVEHAPLTAAGQGWALADLAAHARDTALAAEARRLAAPLLAEALAGRWPGAARSLGALAVLAVRDLSQATPEPRGAPARVVRMLRHRITGR